MSTMTCPAFGSADVDTSERFREVQIPFSEPARVAEAAHVCRTCGESGDFVGTADDAIKLALAEAVRL